MKTLFDQTFCSRTMHLFALIFCCASFIKAQNTLNLTFVVSDYNGYNISCASGMDGSIDLTVLNGIAPYTYAWSNGKTTENITALVAGYYRVTVTDSQGDTGEGEMTLDEPKKMEINLTPFEYPNKYNVSCNQCYNGSIDAEVTGAVAPYTFAWSDGTTTQDRYILGARDYLLKITDANGCEDKSETTTLREPDRNDWTMNGNSGSLPGLHYFGTNDQKDLIFKTHSVERLRLLSDGNVQFSDISLKGSALYIDSMGILKSGGPPYPPFPPDPISPCAYWFPNSFPYWRSGGNYFPYPLCQGEVGPLLGTRSPHDLVFITEDQEQMWLTVDGKLGIGSVPPSGPVDQYRLFVEDGIATRDVLVKLGSWPDYVFEDNYDLMHLNDLQKYINEYGHLPGIPSAEEVEENKGIELGDMQVKVLRTVEEQALYILELKELLDQLRAELEEVKELVELK